MNSHNNAFDRFESHSELNITTDDHDLTFIHAQLDYAKSMHSKKAKYKHKAVKKGWYKKGGKYE